MSSNTPITTVEDFYTPILSIIDETGGEAPVDYICDRFIMRHKRQLDPSLLAGREGQDPKWREYINRAGDDLAAKHYIRRPRPTIWELYERQVRSG